MVTKRRSRGPLSPQDAVELYLGQLNAEGYVRPATLRAYEIHIGRFLRDVDLPEDISQLTARHAIAWANALKGRGLKPGAIRSYQSSVWIWFSWLHRAGHTAVNIGEQVRRHRPDETTVTRRSATPEVVTRMLTVARSRGEHAERNAALILVLLASGARQAELSACDLEDYDRAAGTLYLNRHTKSNRPRHVGIGADARAQLDRYIKIERPRDGRDPRPGPLFMARMNRRMSTEAIRCALRSLASDAGVDASAHDFRRACADRLNEAGATPWTIQAQLGHRSDALTRKYAAASREKAALAEYHALDAARRERRTG